MRVSAVNKTPFNTIHFSIIPNEKFREVNRVRWHFINHADFLIRYQLFFGSVFPHSITLIFLMFFLGGICIPNILM